MVFIVYGVISFLYMYLFDIYTLKDKPFFKRVFGLLGLGMFLYATIMVIIKSNVIMNIPMVIQIISGFLFVMFVMLLIYSLFIELPFVKTYGEDVHNNNVVDTGTYALCRHPGVLWFGFMFLFLFFTTGYDLVLYAGIIWTLLDVIYVILQEKTIFPKMFPNYDDYIKSTPMLFPNKKSIKKCFATVK